MSNTGNKKAKRSNDMPPDNGRTKTSSKKNQYDKEPLLD